LHDRLTILIQFRDLRRERDELLRWQVEM